MNDNIRSMFQDRSSSREESHRESHGFKVLQLSFRASMEPKVYTKHTGISNFSYSLPLVCRVRACGT